MSHDTPLPGPRRPRWLGVYIVGYLIFLYLPIVLIPLFSFNNSVQAAFPLQGFTLDWYRGLAGNEALRAALFTSIGIGISAAFVATLCGLTIAYAELTIGSRLSRVIAGLARMPILIPGVVIGIALLIAVNLIGLGPSRLAIVLGHVLVALPTTVIVIRGSLAAVPRSIPEVAQDLGASDAVVFRRIMLPLALPAAVSAFMLAFLTSFDEFIVAFFLAGTQPTLPLYIWSQLRFPKSLPTVMALGTAILVTSIVIAGAAELLRRRGLRRLPN
ncbi:spermidine/putrescine transport system permease protein [Pseudoxanthobacter soli DSM 19599]|uniref:Spermidine/putrescine transport system permease protein n=1 Tax=Pseudoxanthobacter soli DSM 19599 TaxID=1123029 RepID=A0A1M7ZP05_9HYPH|nr:ABC transporter permease [Pseudoxanthobacter soli]SHO66623.1 spermidine/putrescine transport system permease protein [Pseudoxanthobacter soli DSM 19599]